LIRFFSTRFNFRSACCGWLLVAAGIAVEAASADPFIEPGRPDLRVALQLLADDDVIRVPITAWPISWQSIVTDIEEANQAILSAETRRALDRIETELGFAEQTERFLPHVRIGAATEPRAIRSFSSTPREKGELEAGISYTGDALSFKVNLTRAVDSTDDWRLDGSYFGFATRKWSFVGGYPERWWGPGMQGSLILSTNARPLPQLSVQRLGADGFNKPWLRWLGPWTVTALLGQFDDNRLVNDALLFGVRLTARPLPQLEFAVSRTAQLCGDGRSCGFDDFGNMLLGKDNRGRNVSAEAEPGNQLAGFDGRWSFRERPFAIYWQWIGEDSRQGGPQIGNWLRMIGAERNGSLRSPDWQHRTYVELADATCQKGGLGFGGNQFNCGYQHGTFRSGYRYENRPLGYTTDSDSESMSIISVLTGPNNQSFELAAYSIRVNQGPFSGHPHSLSMTPASRYGIDLSHLRDLPLGQLRVRLSLAEQRDQLTGITDSDSGLAVEWLLGYW
jgi:hypothetical protein